MGFMTPSGHVEVPEFADWGLVGWPFEGMTDTSRISLQCALSFNLVINGSFFLLNFVAFGSQNSVLSVRFTIV